MRSQYCAQYSEVYKCTDASIAPSGYKGKALIYILKFPETGYDTERYVSDFIRYDKYNVAKFLEDISDFVDSCLDLLQTITTILMVI